MLPTPSSLIFVPNGNYISLDSKPPQYKDHFKQQNADNVAT